MKDSYDIIASLGGNCYAAMQLRHRGMRRFSLPLDWTAMEDASAIRKLPDLLRNGFRGFCDYENMVDLGSPLVKGNTTTYKFKDTNSGFQFIHHFHAPLPDREAFEKSRATIERRIRRLYEETRSSRNALFVLETAFAFDENLLLGVYDALHETFPGVSIDLYSMQFNAAEESHGRLAENVEFAKYARHVDPYCDIYGTSLEWAWLDRIRVAGLMKAAERRRSGVLAKLKYKIWKALGKSLYKEGAGCVGLALP